MVGSPRGERAVSGGERRLASRSDVGQILRPHLAPITAMALAADEASLGLVRQLAIPDRDRAARYLRPKLRGTLTAVLWTEGVRQWVEVAQPPGLRIHDPFDWTELLVQERLHVRIQKDRARPINSRRRLRRNQSHDRTLPLTFQSRPITNVDVNTVYSPISDVISRVTIEAPLQSGQVWPPINVSAVVGRRQLISWRRRATTVPWLGFTSRVLELASYDDMARDLRAVAASAADASEMEDIVRDIVADPGSLRATFRPKDVRRPASEES